MQQRSHEPESRRIGLLAAWGRYPVVVAQALKRAGYETYCIGVREHADHGALAPLCRDYKTLGIGRFAAAIRFFRRHGVTHATMAGKFHKKILFQPWIWFRHLPDVPTICHFYPYLAKPGWIGAGRDRKDDTLLGAVVDAFTKRGITFGPATDYAPELLVKFGQLTKRGLTASQRMDIAFGWQIAKELGRLDVGQTVAIKGQAVLAIEAIEGTDKCIERAGSLCRSGGFAVVKVAKPSQDMRFDVPTIGIGTLQSMVDAKATVLAIEAEKTIVIDESAVVAFANRHKLVIVAIDAPAALEAAA